jgi:hypothetical protein
MKVVKYYSLTKQKSSANKYNRKSIHAFLIVAEIGSKKLLPVVEDHLKQTSVTSENIVFRIFKTSALSTSGIALTYGEIL